MNILFLSNFAEKTIPVPYHAPEETNNCANLVIQLYRINMTSILFSIKNHTTVQHRRSVAQTVTMITLTLGNEFNENFTIYTN